VSFSNTMGLEVPFTAIGQNATGPYHAVTGVLHRFIGAGSVTPSSAAVTPSRGGGKASGSSS
jgi:hypothetical protein